MFLFVTFLWYADVSSPDDRPRTIRPADCSSLGLCYITIDENDACFIAMEVGTTINKCWYIPIDENDACFIAMEAGMIKVSRPTAIRIE